MAPAGVWRRRLAFFGFVKPCVGSVPPCETRAAYHSHPAVSTLWPVRPPPNDRSVLDETPTPVLPVGLSSYPALAADPAPACATMPRRAHRAARDAPLPPVGAAGCPPAGATPRGRPPVRQVRRAGPERLRRAGATPRGRPPVRRCSDRRARLGLVWRGTGTATGALGCPDPLPRHVRRPLRREHRPARHRPGP